MFGFLKQIERLKDAEQRDKKTVGPDWTMMSECLQMAMQTGWVKGFAFQPA